MQYSVIEGYFRRKEFLTAAIIAMVGLAFVGTLFNQTYLGIPWTLLMLSSLSLVGVAIFSVPVAFYFVKIHRWVYGRRGWSHEPDQGNHYNFPRVRKMLSYSVLGILGTMYLIHSAIPFLDLHTAQGILAMILLFFVALVASPALYVSTWLLKKIGLHVRREEYRHKNQRRQRIRKIPRFRNRSASDHTDYHIRGCTISRYTSFLISNYVRGNGDPVSGIYLIPS